MQVGRSGFYAWLNRPKSRRTIANEKLLIAIKTEYKRSGETYGSIRIRRELIREGNICSRKRVARLMRLSNLIAHLPKRYKVTTDSNHDQPIAPNLLNREFIAAVPNTKWATDITYIRTGEGWLYLSVVLDLFSRRVVGWSMQNHMEQSLVASALQMAVKGRQPAPGLICHSDRGSQYASKDYQAALKESGIVCSMSRKGNCWDNAPSESFFATLKKELVYRNGFDTVQQATSKIFNWIEVWYNRQRQHSTLDYLSPEAFENKALQNEKQTQRQWAIAP